MAVRKRVDLGPAGVLRRELERALENAPDRYGVSFHGHALALTGNFEPAVDWIRRYLDPWYVVGAEERAASGVVGYFVDEALHDTLGRLLSGLPGSPTQTHKWRPAVRHRLDADCSVYAYRDLPGLTIRDRARDAVAFVTVPEDDDAVYEPARIVREVFTTKLLASGYPVFHAGAVALASGGIVVCGARGAGKTTLICGLLEHLGARFIANDRTYIGTPDPDEAPVVVSWPHGTRVALGTCTGSRALRSWLTPGRTYTYPQHDWDSTRGIDAVSAAAIAAGTPADSAPGIKVELTGRELAAATRTTIETSARVSCTLFPQIDLKASETTVEPVPPEWAKRRLFEELLSPGEEAYPDWLELRSGWDGLAADHGKRVASRIVAAAPSFRLRFRDPAEAARLVADTVGAGASLVG